jgi:TPR repeat protein
MATRFSGLTLAISLIALGTGACSQSSDATLFHKLSAKAELGSAPAQYNLGMLYNNGIGTRQDPRRAFEWFEKSAASGDPLASYKVGCYYSGQFPGVVPVDHEKAVTAKLVAARAGYFRAQHDIGNAYGSNDDFQEATMWWTAAAAQGDIGSLANLSEAFRQGLGVQKDPEKALELMLIVVRQVQSDQKDATRAAIKALKKEVSPQEMAQAEQAAAAWVPKPTELTIRADLGIREAKQLVQ